MMQAHAELARALAQHYGIQTVAVIRRRTVLGVVAEDGQRYIWKPLTLRDDEERLRALADLEPIFSNSMAPCALPLRTRAGAFIVELKEQKKRGYLQPWLSGRHVDVRVQQERLSVLKSLARVQKQSQLANRPGWSTLQRGTLYHKLRMKERALAKIWMSATSVYSPLKRMGHLVETQTMKVLQTYASYLANPRRQAVTDIAFCHRDLAPHNVLWQADGTVAWIDFDHAGYDDMLHDAVQFASHTVFLTSKLTAEDFAQMLDTYATEADLTRERKELLWVLASWPDILVRTVIEWARRGCDPADTTRLEYAMACEKRKILYRQERHRETKRLEA